MGATSGDVNTGSSRCATSSDLASRPVGSKQSGDLAYVTALEGVAPGPIFFYSESSALPASSSVVPPTAGGTGRWLAWSVYGPSAAMSGLVFASRAAITAFDTTGVPDVVTVAKTSTIDASFKLSKTSTLTADGINVLAATPAGRWIRVQEPVYAYVAQQQWYIDYSAAGNDEASGAIGFPIKTFQEWFARTQGHFLFLQNLNLTGTAWPFTDRFHYTLRAQEPTGSSTAVFAVTGQQTVSRAGSCTAASTNPVTTLGAQQFSTITDLLIDWTADVGKLIVAATGARAWILKNMGGGVARVTAWSTAGGVAVAAPPMGTLYNVVTLTSQILAFPSIAPGGDLVEIIDCEIGTTLRSLTSKTEWLGCKLNFGAEVVQQGVFANCLFNGATFNFSNSAAAGILNPVCLIFGSCGFLNADITWSTGHIELEDCCHQASHILAGRAPNGHTGVVGSATLCVSGTYGVGVFDATGLGAAVLLDGRSTIYIDEGLFGRGNAGIGFQLRHQSTAFIKSTTPTLQATGVELSVPLDPIGRLIQAGTAALAGGSQTVAATITAQSRIVVTRNTPAGALGAGGLVVPSGTRVPTSFDVKSVDLAGGAVVTETSTFDWVVTQATADCTTWANYATNFPTGMQTTTEQCAIQ